VTFGKIILIALLTGLIAGCATPVSHTNTPVSKYDKNTRSGFEDNADGFTATIKYSRYQFIPESDAVAIACKSQLTELAWEHADDLGREIEGINEQRIRISMGRNGITGITSCEASVMVKWKVEMRQVRPTEKQHAKSNTASYIDELKALAALRDDGIITEDEFQTQKAEILERE